MHIAYGCFLRWVIPFYHGFQYQTGQNLNDLGYPWNLQYRSEWWKKHLQLAGSVAALILWHRQIYTSQWHPETPGFCANKETLIGGVIRQNFRCVDHRHLLWGKKNKKPLTNCQLWMIGDPLGAPQNHWKKPNRLKPLPLDFLLLICFITFVASIQLQPQGVPVAVSSAVVELGFQQYPTIPEL